MDDNILENGNNEENEVLVFGEQSDTDDTNTDDTLETQTDETTDVEQKEEDLKETEKSETDKAEDTAEDKDKDDKQEPIKDDKDKPFNVSFGKDKTQTESKKTDTPKETDVLTEDSVVDFFKQRGIEINSVSELSKSVELPDEVLKFKEFFEKTGRGHTDFYNAQKDWTKESEDATILEYYKLDKNLSKEKAEKHLNLLKLSEDERDTLSDRDIQKRELEYDEKYREALAFMVDKSKEYKTSLTNTAQEQKPLTKEQITELHKPYWNRRDSSLEKLSEVKMSLGDIGEVTFALSQEHKDLIAKNTQTQEAFFERFKDNKENPNQINTDLSNEATMWGIPEIREAILTSYAEQMYTLFMSEFSKKNRNVDLDNIQNKQEKAQNKDSHVEVIGGGNDTVGMGTSLIG